MTNASTNRPRFVGGQGGSRPTGEKALDRRGTLRRLADYLQPYHARLVLVAALVVVATALGLAGPALLGRAIDAYVIHHDADGLALMVALMAVVYLLQGVFTALHGIIMIPRWAALCRGHPLGALRAFPGAFDGLSRPQPRRRFDEPHFQR